MFRRRHVHSWECCHYVVDFPPLCRGTPLLENVEHMYSCKNNAISISSIGISYHQIRVGRMVFNTGDITLIENPKPRGWVYKQLLYKFLHLNRAQCTYISKSLIQSPEELLKALQDFILRPVSHANANCVGLDYCKVIGEYKLCSIMVIALLRYFRAQRLLG